MTHRVWVTCLVTAVSGLTLGVVDLLGQVALPYPWANLANSVAVWAIAAYGLGAWVRQPLWAAVSGAAMLVLAVGTYEVAAIVFLDDDASTLLSPTTWMWAAFGVIAGAVFAPAGALSRGDRTVARLVARALPAAVLLAEAAVMARSPHQRADHLWTAAIMAVIAVASTAVVCRGARHTLVALAVSLPLAALGFLALTLAGLAG